MATEQEEIRETMTARLGSFTDRLGSLQQSHLNSLLERRRYLASDTALFDPLGHPVVVIGSWISRTDDPLSDTQLDIAESSLLGYLHVRLQDDHLDDGTDRPDAVMMLGDALIARHSALLARHVSSTVFWNAFEELWTNYGEAMLYERSLIESNAVRTAEDFDRLLHRSRPLSIPGLAALAVEDRLAEAPHVMDLVTGIIRSGQLVTDLMDAPADLESGRHTWIVERLDGRQGASALKRAMVREFDGILAEAAAALDSAANAADELAASRATHWIDQRRERLADLQATFFEGLFSPLLSRHEE
ncbi:MAG: class 1 isoprenoid biosynthesis enzyme [Acidimicrobiia bacterium]|nr:class 1 isoprenoid biosynthesis enzyme [Acidimicrobiia bacterium]NNF63836.1 class 1 isoprenoid biosynthesis enzyme [Acidimicrobiia bacterium]